MFYADQAGYLLVKGNIDYFKNVDHFMFFWNRMLRWFSEVLPNYDL